jgi:hypothetical protein
MKDATTNTAVDATKNMATGMAKEAVKAKAAGKRRHRRRGQTRAQPGAQDCPAQPLTHRCWPGLRGGP